MNLKSDEEIISAIADSILSQVPSKKEGKGMHIYDVMKAVVKYAKGKDWTEYEYKGVKHATYSYDIQITAKHVKVDGIEYVEVYHCGNLVYVIDILKFVLLPEAFKRARLSLLKKRK